MPSSQVVPDTVPVPKAHIAPHRKNFGRAQSFVVKQQVGAFPPLFIHHVLLKSLTLLLPFPQPWGVTESERGKKPQVRWKIKVRKRRNPGDLAPSRVWTNASF